MRHDTRLGDTSTKVTAQIDWQPEGICLDPALLPGTRAFAATRRRQAKHIH